MKRRSFFMPSRGNCSLKWETETVHESRASSSSRHDICNDDDDMSVTSSDKKMTREEDPSCVGAAKNSSWLPNAQLASSCLQVMDLLFHFGSLLGLLNRRDYLLSFLSIICAVVAAVVGFLYHRVLEARFSVSSGVPPKVREGWHAVRILRYLGLSSVEMSIDEFYARPWKEWTDEKRFVHGVLRIVDGVLRSFPHMVLSTLGALGRGAPLPIAFRGSRIAFCVAVLIAIFSLSVAIAFHICQVASVRDRVGICVAFVFALSDVVMWFVPFASLCFIQGRIIASLFLLFQWIVRGIIILSTTSPGYNNNSRGGWKDEDALSASSFKNKRWIQLFLTRPLSLVITSLLPVQVGWKFTGNLAIALRYVDISICVAVLNFPPLSNKVLEEWGLDDKIALPFTTGLLAPILLVVIYFHAYSAVATSNVPTLAFVRHRKNKSSHRVSMASVATMVNKPINRLQSISECSVVEDMDVSESDSSNFDINLLDTLRVEDLVRIGENKSPSSNLEDHWNTSDSFSDSESILSKRKLFIATLEKNSIMVELDGKKYKEMMMEKEQMCGLENTIQLLVDEASSNDNSIRGENSNESK